MSEGSASVRELTELSHSLHLPDYPATNSKPNSRQVFWLEFVTVFKYSSKRRTLNPTYSILTILTSVLFALTVAFLWFQLPPVPSSSRAVYRVITIHALFFTLLSNFGGGVSRMEFLPTKLGTASKVHMSCYSVWLGSYFGSLPLKFITVFLTCVIIYPIVGLRPGVGYFLLYQLALTLQSLGNSAFGMNSPAIFLDPILVSWGNFTILIFNYLFNGIPYSTERISWVLRWLRYLSPSYYADQILIASQFDGYTYPGSTIKGSDILGQTGWYTTPLSLSIILLICLTIFYNLTGILFLHLTTCSRFKK